MIVQCPRCNERQLFDPTDPTAVRAVEIRSGHSTRYTLHCGLCGEDFRAVVKLPQRRESEVR